MQFALSADPSQWGSNLSLNHPEPDDNLHNPEVKDGKVIDHSNGSSGILSARGVANLGCLGILCLTLVALLYEFSRACASHIHSFVTSLGYPVVSFVERTLLSPSGGVPVNATGQIASIGNFGLIDLETPPEAHTITSLYTGRQMKLVFSDEFNTDGRTFYPGDDPFWEAEDLHYWAVRTHALFLPAVG
jgi:hypothetical protein